MATETPRARWIDLTDPRERDIVDTWSSAIHPQALNRLTSSAGGADDVRSKFEAHGSYLFGILLVPKAVPDEDRIFFQEIDIVIAHRVMLTVRKSPPGGDPMYDPDVLRADAPDGTMESVGMAVYHLFNDVAERYLEVVDDLDAEINELEDHLDSWSADEIRKRIGDLRHDLLNVRRKLVPLRDTMRRIHDGHLDLPGEELFPKEIEVHFADAYDKVLRATDALEYLREILSGVRDYHQAQVANEQNEVMKRLTVIASVLLVPTLVVGLYGQNFTIMPELKWRFGYLFSWGLIVLSTVAQIWYFRKKKWI